MLSYMKKQGETFSEKVVRYALAIPKGRVTTYGRLAREAGGGTMASQSITSILWKAEQRGVKGIPYHRIVYADGRVWMSKEHRAERLALYRKEKIALDKDDYIIDFKKHLL
jgi:alkylated DNA nucleotide flippase Atl1